MVTGPAGGLECLWIGNGLPGYLAAVTTARNRYRLRHRSPWDRCLSGRRCGTGFGCFLSRIGARARLTAGHTPALKPNEECRFRLPGSPRRRWARLTRLRNRFQSAGYTVEVVTIDRQLPGLDTAPAD